MTLKKKAITVAAFLLAAFLVYGLYFGVQYAYVGSSYNAKVVCSCMFVSKRSLDNIKTEELYAVPFSNIDADTVKKTVEVNIYGIARAKAIYRDGLGCTLVNEVPEEEIRKQPGLPVMASVPDLLLPADTLSGDYNMAHIKAVIEEAFKEEDPENIKRTRAVVILHKGRLITEKYAPNISAETPLLGWSMTKSVTNAMIGLMVKDGKIDIHRPAPVTEWANDDRHNITTDHLLRMSSGLIFEENYGKPSDATRMLFRKKAAGVYAMTSYAGAKPGEKWYYSSGTTNILQEIVRRKFSSHAEYLAFPHIRLFRKIGMNSAVIEPDASGTYIGSSFMYATARDWAKFGQLYLQDGVWNGERLLPEGWVKYSATETPHSGGSYAAQFWVGHYDKDFPADAFFADGFEGQFVTIVPSKDMVIVRLGCTPKSNFNNLDFVKKILQGVKNQNASPVKI